MLARFSPKCALRISVGGFLLLLLNTTERADNSKRLSSYDAAPPWTYGLVGYFCMARCTSAFALVHLAVSHLGNGEGKDR